MDEIKFRAWDNINEEMMEVHALVLESNCLNVKDYYVGSQPHLLDQHNDLHAIADCKLMQYIGLRDKNGNEIYEGDILHIEIRDHWGGQPIASANEVVDYQDCKFGVLWGFHRDFTCLTSFCETTFEVIGNIYENPDFLK